MIRTLEMDSSGKSIRIVSDPRDFEYEEKKKAKAEERQYLCLCRKDIKLLYSFSTDLKYCPCQHYKNDHASSCDLSELYSKPRSGVKKDRETGKLSANLYENLSERPKRSAARRRKEQSVRLSTAEEKERTKKTISFIKEINLNKSRQQASWRSAPKTLYEFGQCIWNEAAETSITHNGEQRMLNDRDSEDRFFYDVLKDVTLFGKGLNEYGYDISKVMEKLESIKGSKKYHALIEIGYLYNGEVRTKRRVITIESLYYALEGYRKEYRAKYIEPDKANIIATGYSYPDAVWDERKLSAVRGIDRLWLFNTCSHGIYAESSYEAKAFDTIFELIKTDKDLHFYKPDIFDRTAYKEGGYLEDGILTADGCLAVGVLEVYGITNDEGYETRKARKQETLRELEKNGTHTAIEWEPYHESEEILKQKILKAIERIKATRIT